MEIYVTLTDREEQILQILQTDPMITQKDIAERLDITRSSVAVHISNLSNKGYIKGKGYIFNAKQHIVVIGAANIDLTGIAENQLHDDQSNIGKLTIGAGGVARNIADNFARLSKNDDISTYFLSAIGKDHHGQIIIEASHQAGIDLSYCQVLNDQQTASYLSIVDGNGNMRTAINDMAIVEHIDIDYLSSKKQLLNDAKLIIIDANIPQQSIEYICQNYGHIAIFADTVSAVKAVKFENVWQYIHCATPNLAEAQIITNISAEGVGNLDRLAEYFHKTGIEKLFITIGHEGVFRSAKNDLENAKTFSAIQEKIVNANGAGDAFLAGLAYAYCQQMLPDNQVYFAQICAFLTTQSEKTINPLLSKKTVLQYMEKLNA